MRRLIRSVTSIAWTIFTPLVVHADDAQIAGIGWRMNTLIQALEESERYGSFFNDETDNSLSLEGRVDVEGHCAVSWCQGTNLIAKPRVRWFDEQSTTYGLVHPKNFAWDEVYASGGIGEHFTWLAGKHYLSWGPGLLYSPTNRLFPDNGASTPRREIAGKSMGVLSDALSPEWSVYAAFADAYVQPVPGINENGGFALLRAEYTNTGKQPTTAGVVLGGGGGYQPYAGGYAQHLLNDAWTVGAEVSASTGYAREQGAGTGLRQDQHRLMSDALVNLRYGLRSGGELGIEFVYNGYRLSSAELQSPLLASQPAAGIWQTRNVPLHPLPEGRYLLLQVLEPRLFGDNRLGLTARATTGLDSRGNATFIEASYAPRDDLTLYVGATQTVGPRDSEVLRTLGSDIYGALEFHF
jgi:hypothetical protein